jgi:hypothetical protein
MRFIKLLAIFIFSTQLFAQEGNGKWEAVYNEGTDRVFIDVSGLANFYGDDIYVWSLTEHTTPIELESIPDKIYRTNTYYLFNTRIRKYSILYIIYYDENKNVLASYDYGRNTKVEVYQYNYPLMKNSLEERIFDKCVEAREEAHKK